VPYLYVGMALVKRERQNPDGNTSVASHQVVMDF
jgi:hypothetical protein